MAQVHSLDVPISKEPTWLWNTMNRWMSNMKLTLASAQPKLTEEDENAKVLSSAVRSILRWQLDAEMDWMRSYLAQLRSPVVFCHNVWCFHLNFSNGICAFLTYNALFQFTFLGSTRG